MANTLISLPHSLLRVLDVSQHLKLLSKKSPSLHAVPKSYVIRNISSQPNLQPAMEPIHPKPFHTTLSSSHIPASCPLAQRTHPGCHSTLLLCWRHSKLCSHSHCCWLLSDAEFSYKSHYPWRSKAPALALTKIRTQPKTLRQKAVIKKWHDSGSQKGGHKEEEQV